MYTFDVFDTLIARKTATPEGIFALMQKKLQEDKKYMGISDYIKYNFFHLRINSERMARRSFGVTGAEEITLKQIYEAMSSTGCLSSKDIQLLIGLEKKTEYENTLGIKVNIQKVKELIAKGEQVALISDMYLDERTIKDMIVKADPIFKDINLYVSSEYEKSKWMGSLYSVVKKHERVEYANWIHMGDNLYSDIKIPKSLGIKTELFCFEPLKTYEKNALENRKHDCVIQLMVGAARNVRLENRFTGAAAIGSSVGGIILFPYVWWLLQESIKKGISKLYFIARDGYVLKKIADIIIEKYAYEIETYYIYGSRKVWRMSSFSKNNNDLYKFIGWANAGRIKDTRKLAEILEIPFEELMKFIPESFLYDGIKLKEFLVKELVKELNSNQVFKEYLMKVHKEKRKRVTDYMKQEIDVSGDSFAFVELSGGGFTQGCVADIISDFYDKKIKSFFFQLYQMNVMDNCIYYNFLPSFLHLGFIVELLCRAPHGQTIGYRKEDGEIIPIIQEDEGTALLQHGFNEYLLGIEKFTDQYSSILKTEYINGGSLELVFEYMEYITKVSDNEVLDFIGGMPFGVTGREKEVKEFAPVLSKKEIRSLFLWRTNEPIEDYYKGSSLEYSILRCCEEDKKRIEFYTKHQSMFLGKTVRFLKKVIKPISRYGLAADFPCELLGRRVVLYAAGKFGQDLYQKINHSKNNKVVQWVDQSYKRYQKMGLKVHDPNKIGEKEYDNIVIAVLDEKVAKNIRELLVEHGIPNHKIIWVNLRPNWLSFDSKIKIN